ncbi:hypothetical protein I4U23_030003 [Adineta vaga]|nr:hypothetical protein I4U23_030003 [Adineta vaga]
MVLLNHRLFIHHKVVVQLSFTQPDMTIYNQNGNSAFKPHVSQQSNLGKSPILSPSNQPHGHNLLRPAVSSSQTSIHTAGITNGNHTPSKAQQPPPVPNIKRTESAHKPGVHVGITNPSGPACANPLVRQRLQTVPQFHQSMLNLSSIDATESVNGAQPATGMFGSRVSLQQSAANFMKHPAYAQQPTKTNGNHHHHHHHHHAPPPAPPPPPPPPQQSAPSSTSSSRPPPVILEDPIIKWIQQVNDSSSINGLSPDGGGGNRPKQPTYPYGSYITAGSGITPAMNDTDHPNRQQAQQSYLNQVNVHKHHTPQHTVPVQSAFFTSSPIPRSSLSSLQAANVYHFSHHHHHHSHHSHLSQQVPLASTGGGQTRPQAHRQNMTVTTYL